MIGKLINDYICTGKGMSLKETPRGVGDIAMFPLTLQVIAIVRGIMLGGVKYLWTDAIRDSIFTIAFFIIWISQIKHPIKMSRMYYLCPMNADERVAYIKNAYFFRCIFHSILIVTACIILYTVFDVSLYSLLYILLCGLMYSFLSNVRDNKTDFMRAVFLKPAMYISSYIQFAVPASHFGRDEMIFTVCSFAFLLIVELPMFISVIRAINDDIRVVATGEDYSRC
ncbi:MAG: hypothetical protein IJM34_03795 [Lachnospiraceae bacterium]|nr:hypothetical protein [Lachnospiraceae bacterium]